MRVPMISMTMGEIYQKGKSMLSGAENDSPAFDTACLFQKAFGLDRQSLILHSADTADAEKSADYLEWIEQRASGRPLQYILGKWPFMDLDLNVGEGVLIPREETELLVYTAADRLKNHPCPQIIDLCAGTGAVALGMASLLPCAQITAAELYDAAFTYLKRNQEETGLKNVTPVQLDVLNPQSALRFSELDCIVSNPPYVLAGEIPTLQAEVRREPPTALDGGEDGLVFYRAIAKYWLPKLAGGGTAAVEVGEKQAHEVAALFEAAGLTEIQILPDFNQIERVVWGVWQNS
jgi:release factor glutamine methyltransferase